MINQSIKRAFAKQVFGKAVAEKLSMAATAASIKQTIDEKIHADETKSSSESMDNDKINVTQLFSLLDKDDNGSLTEDEFLKLFSLLDVSIDQHKALLMFAYCDYQEDNNGEVSKDEFLEAWGWLEEQLAESFATEHGVSRSEMIIMIVSIVISILFTFAFLFLGMVAFNTSGSFAAVVNSTLIGGAGAVVSYARKKPTGEQIVESTPEKIQAIVGASLAHHK